MLTTDSQVLSVAGMDIRRLVHRIAEALGPTATPAQIEAAAAAALEVLGTDGGPAGAGRTSSLPPLHSVTLGVSLRDCASTLPQTVRARAYDKIRRAAGPLVSILDAGPAQSVACRLAVTPISMVADGQSRDDLIGLARILDAAGADVGLDAVFGYTALVERGMTGGDAALLDAIPAALASTKLVWASVRCATSVAGVNRQAVGRVAAALPGGGRLVALCNAGSDHPTVDGAFHGPAGPEAELHATLSPAAVLDALDSDCRSDPGCVARASFEAARTALDWLRVSAEEVSRRSGIAVAAGGIDVARPAGDDERLRGVSVEGFMQAAGRGTSLASRPGAARPTGVPRLVELPAGLAEDALAGLLTEALTDGVRTGRTVVCRTTA